MGLQRPFYVWSFDLSGPPSSFGMFSLFLKELFLLVAKFFVLVKINFHRCY